MLRPTKAFTTLKLRARDGDIGHPRDFYIDDRNWTVRYLVADTGGWLSGRHVLLSPHALQAIVEDAQVLVVDLSKQQIENSPLEESERPISRQFESAYFVYYGWPGFWIGSTALGVVPILSLSGPPAGVGALPEPVSDPHLRSTHDLIGYHLSASDGEIGHIAEFLIDERTWMATYLIVETGHWWAGKLIVVPSSAITTWDGRKAHLALSRQQLASAPEFAVDQPLTAADEARWQLHYARQSGDAAQHA
jgi:hypothetical protein